MRLDDAACRERLGGSGHAVLGTIHPDRGPDLVPVVYVVDGERISIPIDTVKPKSGRRLQRLVNLAADDRCVLLVDHYAQDWSQLWWVRAHGRGVEVLPSAEVLAALGAAFPAYRPPGAVTSVIAVQVTSLTGWSAAPSTA
jgi:PPOX class probable F420-dependent enzyme